MSNKSTASKKDAVLGSKNKFNAKIIIPAALAVVVLVVAGAMFMGQKGDQVSATVKSGSKHTVQFAVADFADGQAKYYEHVTADQIKIRFFILKSSDGIIRAAFDACDVCWPANKGYQQDGDVMVCRNCGRRFASVKVNEVKGGCNPAPLQRRVEGGNLIIRIKDILDGRRFFDFSQAAMKPAGNRSAS